MLRRAVLLPTECATAPTTEDPNANFTSCVNAEPGTECTATCALGWTQVAAPVATCQLGGTWSVTGTCQRVGEYQAAPWCEEFAGKPSLTSIVSQAEA